MKAETQAWRQIVQLQRKQSKEVSLAQLNANAWSPGEPRQQVTVRSSQRGNQGQVFTAAGMKSAARPAVRLSSSSSHRTGERPKTGGAQKRGRGPHVGRRTEAGGKQQRGFLEASRHLPTIPCCCCCCWPPAAKGSARPCCRVLGLGPGQIILRS